MKTETLYLPKTEVAKNIVKSDHLFDPIDVHVGEYYVKKIPFQIKELRELCESGFMEKVSHVLPMQAKLKIVESPNKIELKKKVDELKSELAAFKAASKLADDIIFRQKNDEISRLKKELEEAKANLEQTKAASSRKNGKKGGRPKKK